MKRIGIYFADNKRSLSNVHHQIVGSYIQKKKVKEEEEDIRTYGSLKVLVILLDRGKINNHPGHTNCTCTPQRSSIIA